MVISFCAHRRRWGVVDGAARILLRRGGTGQWSGSGRPWDVVDSGVVIVEDFEIVSWHHSDLASQFTQPPVHLTVIVLLHHGNNITLSEGDFVRRLRHVVVARSREQRCTLQEKRKEAYKLILYSWQGTKWINTLAWALCWLLSMYLARGHSKRVAVV